MGISAYGFEPLLPAMDAGMASLTVDVYRQTAVLGEKLHPLVRPAVSNLIEKMNCYYSNLIEGYHTRLVDIDAALEKNYAAGDENWRLQQLSIAHIHAEREMRARLARHPDEDICSAEFLCWLHHELYSRLPEDLRWIESDSGIQRKVTPGEMRRDEGDRVKVGSHYAPAPREIQSFLVRFHEAYRSDRMEPLTKVVAWAASHHRLAWIHPFLDGNGRVARLFSTAYAIQIGVNAGGLWSISRGLAHKETGEYKLMLANADSERIGSLDGRGALSESQLKAFCFYFQKTSLDQIKFMSNMLDLDRFKARIRSFVDMMGVPMNLRPEAADLLVSVVERGELDRGDAPRITGLGERVARDLLGDLLKHKLLDSPSPKGKIHFTVPAIAVEYYFPKFFYPEPLAPTPVAAEAITRQQRRPR